MLAAESPTAPLTRVPLQPKNIIHILTPKPIKKTPQKCNAPIVGNVVVGCNGKSNKNVNCPWVSESELELVEVSLAEELSAVRQKLERLRVDKEKTEKMLEDRDKLLDLKMVEIDERGEFQRELEIEVDRLYRLKQLKPTCMKSPVRSLREKELEKKSKAGVSVSQSAKSKQSKEKELINENSTATETSSFTFETTSSASASATTSTSTTAASVTTSTWNSTATSKMRVVPPRLSIGSASTFSSKVDHEINDK